MENTPEQLILSMVLGDYIGKIADAEKCDFNDTFLMCTFLGIYLMETAKDTIQRDLWLKTWADAKKNMLKNE